MSICRTRNPALTHARGRATTLPRNVATQRERGRPVSATPEDTEQTVTIDNVPFRQAARERSDKETEYATARACELARFVQVFPSWCVTRANWIWEFLRCNRGSAQTTHLLPVNGKQSRRFVTEIKSIDVTGGGHARLWARRFQRSSQLPHRHGRASALLPLESTAWRRPVGECGIAGRTFPLESAERERWRAGPSTRTRVPKGVARGRS
jgi:hypothetical protein